MKAPTPGMTSRALLALIPKDEYIPRYELNTLAWKQGWSTSRIGSTLRVLCASGHVVRKWDPLKSTYMYIAAELAGGAA